MHCDISHTEIPLHPNDPCGDVCAYWRHDHTIVLMVSDGLGHGASARKASLIVKEYIKAHAFDSIEAIFHGCHHALKDTRGAVLAYGIIDLEKKELHYASVGSNQAKLIYKHKQSTLPSHPGFLGWNDVDHFSPVTVTLDECSLLILFTDGIDRHLKIENDIHTHESAQSIVDQLISKWAIVKDDVGLLVCKFLD